MKTDVRILAMAVACVAVSGCSGSDTPPVYHMKTDALACWDRPTFDHFLTVLQENLDAAQILATQKIAAGDCTMFKKGETVQLVQVTGVLSGDIQIQRVGDPNHKWWVNHDEINW